jgi:hypothetical protein
MPRLQITPEDFKRAKLVKPGWYPTLILDVNEELSSKKDSMNIVLDLENSDRESGFFGVPCKHWLSEKGVAFPGGGASLAKAFNPTLDEGKIADVEFGDLKGRYIYAKWGQNRGKDGNDPPRNVIEDWAPLPKKYSDLANAVKDVSSDVEGFAKV